MTATYHAGFSGPEYEPIAEPLRGFRAWLIEDAPMAREPTSELGTRGFDGGLTHGRLLRGALHGVFRTDYLWGSRDNEAVCLRPSFWGYGAAVAHRGGMVVDKIPPHTQVIAECDCGLWAFTAGEHFVSVSGPAALGVVEGWGRMVVGPLGFRAQKARILALTFAARSDVDSKHPWKEVTDGLRAAVQLLYPNVAYFDTVAELQAAYPLSDTAALLPTTPEELDA